MTKPPRKTRAIRAAAPSPHHTSPTTRHRSYDDFVGEFVGITGMTPKFDSEYETALQNLVDYLRKRKVRTLDERRRHFLSHVNWKFRLNANPLATFYEAAAHRGFTFHYHQKTLVQRSFDLRDKGLLESLLETRGVPQPDKKALLALFHPVEDEHTLEHLRRECEAPTKLRREKGDRDIAGEIVKAHFSAFMWGSVPERDMHRFFDPDFAEEGYRDSFWEQLQQRTPHLFNREQALHIVHITQDTASAYPTPEALREHLCTTIARLYERLNNYGFLAIIIEPVALHGRSLEWELAADLTLFGEKHREQALKKSYFQWERVKAETLAHIPDINAADARFDLINEGYTYRDCFVLANNAGTIERLLLIFQKNERDETPIPCPTCRTAHVQGNSYPTLGVRSWECNNLLCPDRSKYNRGKRYSFRALVMQQAIDDDRSEIPVESVRRWSRDVVTDVTDTDLQDMLVRHYSMHGDVIHAYNWPSFPTNGRGRHTTHHNIPSNAATASFWTGPFFRRYAIQHHKEPSPAKNLGTEDFQVLLGDSATVLLSLPASSVDGAVTSPPYYNAREYAQWPNMYCHLSDMFAVNSAVFRVLKPGALYLYNVFDYFDNENTIVFSAMGQRRMILSAYTVDLFRRIGFDLLGNVVWDKGDIQGKRGFNAGNFSPYYQSPFNCWEHVLVFQKPQNNSRASRDIPTLAGRVLRQQPVMKMVRGENVHGHTAPFPDAIPELLVTRLPKRAVVLDPFGGSLTTGRVAERHGLRSICVERSEEYCRLGLRMRQQETHDTRLARAQISLF